MIVEEVCGVGARLPAGIADFHFGGIIEIARSEMDVMNDSTEKRIGIRRRIVDQIARDIIGVIDQIASLMKSAVVENLRIRRVRASPVFDTDRDLWKFVRRDCRRRATGKRSGT
jgi:hypothetical protein